MGLRIGKVDAHAQSRFVVFEAEPRPMQLGDRVDQAEAEAVARCGPGLVQTDEAVQDLFAAFILNAGAAVGDRDGRACGDGERDLATFRRVFDRVVQEVG